MLCTPAEERKLTRVEVMMRARVERCPGGLAVVVPNALADRLGLIDGASVDLEVAGNHLQVTPAPATLDELLAKITPENLHGEWADGPPAGAELL